MRLHHIAYAVEDIDEAVAGFEKLGYERDGEMVEFPTFSVYIQFLRGGSSPAIELVAPMSDRSTVSRRLAGERGYAQLYHLCYEVDDIKAASRELRQLGFLPTTRIEPGPGVGFRPVCFFTSKGTGLIELVQSSL